MQTSVLSYPRLSVPTVILMLMVTNRAEILVVSLGEYQHWQPLVQINMCVYTRGKRKNKELEGLRDCVVTQQDVKALGISALLIATS